MSTASLGHNSKESNMQGSNSGGRLGLCGSLPRGGMIMNPPTVTSIDMLESQNNNEPTRSSVVVEDQKFDIKGKLDSRVSSM